MHQKMREARESGNPPDQTLMEQGKALREQIDAAMIKADPSRRADHREDQGRITRTADLVAPAVPAATRARADLPRPTAARDFG